MSTSALIFPHGQKHKNRKSEDLLSFVIVAHSFQHLDSRSLLARRQADPAVKQLFHIRGQLHHIGIREELRHGDAESLTDCIKGCDGRDCISSKDISDGGLRQTAFLRKLILRPTAFPQQLLEPGVHAFLLCTDGFWEYVLEEEMEQDLRLARSAKQWLEKMRRRLQARAPADQDNNSAIVIWKSNEKREENTQ